MGDKVKKKIINIYLFLIGLIFIIAGVVPNIIDNIEYKKLEQEIILVSNSLKKNNISNLDIDIDKKITIKNNKVENKIEDYLLKVIKTTTSITNAANDSRYNQILDINNLPKEKIDSLFDYLDYVKNNFNSLSRELSNIKLDNLNDEKYTSLLKSINTDNYNNIIIDNLEKIESYKKILFFLKENANYEIDNKKVVFLKRNNYDEFVSLINEVKSNNLNMFEFDLIKDLEGPVINANDITIYEGSFYNLDKGISCVDLIDGNVTCDIEGNFDKNRVGIYPIKISATDKSGITSEKVININVIEKEKLKYYTEIIRNYNTVIVYELDENKEYTKIARVFPCSTGREGRTPTGIFYTTKGSVWGPLLGGVWGQYYTVITGNILFHSVPYYTMSKDNLEWQEYNKLGEYASAGCVRLSVIDAKWVYENCPNGMKIKIYDGELPPGVSKPIALKIDENSPFRGWDPTDPDINNPWNSVSNTE